MRLSLFIFMCVCSLVLHAQISFSDISDIAHIQTGTLNHGIGLGDYNNDGWEDIYVATKAGNNKLFRNNGDLTFTDVTEASGTSDFNASYCALFCDIDNDGDQDLYIGNFNAPNSLFMNQGDDTFTEEAELRGVNHEGQLRSMNVADVNHDGWLDIYLVNMNEENMLYMNNGDGTFTDVLFFSGAFDTLVGMGSIFFDYDNDGDQDLYLTHDANGPNKLYANNGDGSFTDMSVASGLNHAGQGMGVDISDVNSDGWMDVYITNNYDGNSLYLANGDGTYTDISESAGIMDPGMSWGITWTDADMDGNKDIYFVNDYNFSPYTNKLYYNTGSLTFFDLADGTPLESPYGGAGLACGDLDRNGTEDLIIAIGGMGNGFDNQVLLNNLEDFHWIGIGLEGTESNRDAIGTRISVYLEEHTHHDEINCGSGYSGQNSKQLLFGLGESTGVDSVEIRWPSGLLETYYSPNINQYHYWIEGQAPVIDDDPYLPPTHNIQEVTASYPDQSLNLEEINKAFIKLYPNPAMDHTRLVLASPSTVQIRDLTGRILWETQVVQTSEIDTKNWPSGHYIVSASSPLGTWSTRFAVVK